MDGLEAAAETASTINISVRISPTPLFVDSSIGRSINRTVVNSAIRRKPRGLAVHPSDKSVR
jgi:hypothetical protein